MARIDSIQWTSSNTGNTCRKHQESLLPCRKCIKTQDEDIKIELTEEEMAIINTGEFTLKEIIPPWQVKRLLH